MKIRHRIPSIFNLSMVDVLCCALGCVILLWLLNLREARDRAEKVGQTSDLLKQSESLLNKTRDELAGTARQRDDLSQREQAIGKERDAAQRKLREAGAVLQALERTLESLRGQKADAEDRLARLSREQKSLMGEKANLLARLESVQGLLRSKEATARTSARKADELATQLQDEETRAQKLEAEIGRYRTRLRNTEARVESLEAEAVDRKKDLLEAQHNIDSLQQDKHSLADQASRARAAMENRFEGIALTGRRVLFLVDMSGSMELVDERTPAPSKWEGVREAMARIMRSLTDLEKFQLIAFSDKITYPLGNEGRWIDYDPKTSADQAFGALAAIRPKGATNMYEAFDAAFRFRPSGLDTVYVLSDGLPNIGPGLTQEQTNTLKESEQSDILARYIRSLLRTTWNRPLSGQPTVRINAIGFFYESPDVGAFLWALARENNGSFVGMSKP
jgi:von Willebrand factor type A domain